MKPSLSLAAILFVATALPVSISAQSSIEVMSWVPPYSIAQAQAAAQADFGTCDATDGLTRVGLQFWTPNADGSIKYANHEWYTPTDSDVVWWKNWCDTNGIECLLTIYNNTGSWDWDLARSAFASNRTVFVTALISEMDRLNLDGIDLDLEGIGNLDADRSAFDQFVHDLWIELDARGKILTIDSFHYIWNAPNQNWWSDWIGEVDKIHSMGYEDLYESGTSYQPYSFQQGAGYAAGYPGDAVLMGMPSYVASWGSSSGRGTTAQAHVQEVRYDLAETTGIAIWDLQLSQWQNSALWCEIKGLKESGGDPPPATPTNLAASTFSNSQIDLVWSDNSLDEVGFKVERSPTGAGNWTEIAALGADTIAFSDAGRPAGTAYDYRVFAHNANGQSGSNISTASTFTIPRTIQFSGRSWTVKSSDSQVGPGPNYFSDKGPDIWVDENDKLHMRITHRDGKWYSSEVITDEVLGHGKYTFTLEGRVDQLNENVVVGLFTWDSSAPEFNYREVDIEFAKWGNATDPTNSQYVVQPYDTPDNLVRFASALDSDFSTHSLDWQPDRVDFSSHQGHGSLLGPEIFTWSNTGDDIPPEGTTSGNARINLWLFQGAPPSDGQELELIIEAFDHEASTPSSLGISVDLTAFLEGPFSTGSMTTTLNSGGHLSDSAIAHPYAGPPWNYPGTESVIGGFFAANPTVVDWVLVKLYTGTLPTINPADSAVGLLLSDGSIVRHSNTSQDMAFDVAAGSYYVAVLHRNHLSIISSSKVDLSVASPSYNFTTASGQAYSGGSPPQAVLTGGVFGLLSGDGSKDGKVTAVDFNDWLTDTKAAATGYLASDFNMDGQVTASDFNAWLTNTKASATSQVP